MEMNFCRRCGTKLAKQSAFEFRCAQGHEMYVNPAPGASIILLDGKNIVLSERAIRPNKGLYDFFGGFMELGEDFAATATREIFEETGLSPDGYEPLTYLGSYASSYDFGGEVRPIISVYFYAQLQPGAQIVPSDDSAAVVRMPFDQIDWERVSAGDTTAALRDIVALMRQNRI